jgi:tRNA-dihydrouridine synthase B
LKKDFFISLKNAGVHFITIHGRLAKDFFSSSVNWDYIEEVSSYNLPIIGNGDIFKPKDAQNILNKRNVKSIMIGRGALSDPYIFLKIKGEEGKIPEKKELFFINFLNERGEDFITIKKFSYFIFREKRNVKRIREMINNSKNIDDILKICDIWYNYD